MTMKNTPGDFFRAIAYFRAIARKKSPGVFFPYASLSKKVGKIFFDFTRPPSKKKILIFPNSQKSFATGVFDLSCDFYYHKKI